MGSADFLILPLLATCGLPIRSCPLPVSATHLVTLRNAFVIGRRLMPLVGLGRDYLDATGKTLSLLWLVFLLVGPTWQAMRRFCNMVKAVVTDMGTERLILNALPPAALMDFETAFIEKLHQLIIVPSPPTFGLRAR